VLTPALAILTVAALISTGIVLGQEDGGQADAMLISSIANFSSSAGTETTLVTDAGPAWEEDDWAEQLSMRTNPTVAPAPAEPDAATPGVVTEDQGSSYRASSGSSASTARLASATPTAVRESDHSTEGGAVSGESDESEHEESEHHESDSHESEDD